MNYEEEIIQAIHIGLAVATFLLNIGHALKAIELCKESLVLLNTKALSMGKQIEQFIHEQFYFTMFEAYCRVSDDTNAITYGRKLLAIERELGYTVQEGCLSITLAQIYGRQSMRAEAKELLERAIPVIRKTGNRGKEAEAYGELGNVFYSLEEYVKAKEFYEKAIAIMISEGIADRDGAGRLYGNLGTVFRSLGEYVKAKLNYEKALPISIETGDREAEGKWYKNLGGVFQSLGEYVKAKQYYQKALPISIETGDRVGEGTCYSMRSTRKLVKEQEKKIVMET